VAWLILNNNEEAQNLVEKSETNAFQGPLSPGKIERRNGTGGKTRRYVLPSISYTCLLSSVRGLTWLPDHCVEYIRESLMCQPDLSMVTFRWINNTAQHEDKANFWPTNFDVDMHKCANWQALDMWAGERMFNLFDVHLLNRPQPE